MARLEPIRLEHYRDLYNVAMEAEPFNSDMTLAQFMYRVARYEGWTVLDGNRIIGAVAYGEFVPLLDAILHVFVHPDRHGSWVTKGMLRKAFEFPFITLDLPRVSGFAVDGVSDHAGAMLRRLGFTDEGCKRHGCRIRERLYNVRIYGMLREECKWL